MFKLGIPSLIKSQRNKRFTFKPRYYDEVKEHVEHREKLVSEKQKSEAYKADFKAKVNEKWSREYRKAEQQKANKRIVFIILLLSAIAYYFLK